MLIDVNKVYQVGNYSFRNFVSLSHEEQIMVWNWRNSDKVRLNMANTNLIDLQNHLNFISSLKNRTDKYYWLVYKRDVPIGVIDLFDIDYSNNSSGGGYYLSPDIMSFGDGFDFHYHYKVFIFDVIEVQLFYGPLFIDNKDSFALVTFMGGHYTSVEEINSQKYLLMNTKKADFDLVKDKVNDIHEFVKHIHFSNKELKQIKTKLSNQE